MRTVENMEMVDAFALVLEMARDNQLNYAECPAEFRLQSRALDLVTAYHLIKVKGK